MTRVSLKEAYDNKDVVAQIYAIRDIAEGASDTADSAKTTADDAKTYVDTLGAQVEGAVQTANNASASAQASAQTVAQYDTRLTNVEGGLDQAESDIDGLETGLGAVTLRVQTAEGQIVTIQGRVTALETADDQNVKINNINAYAVGLTGNQSNIYGTKEFNTEIRRKIDGNFARGILNRNSVWKIGENVDSQVTFWPIAVSNEGVTDFPLLISMSENTMGDLFGVECKGQNNLTFGLRLICSSTDVSLYLVSGNATQLISRITR